MESGNVNLGDLAANSKVIGRRLLTIGENRLELLLLEVQEERMRLLRAMVMALGVAVFGLLAGITFTTILVVFFWARSPIGVLVVLTAVYATAAMGLWLRLNGILRDWKTLAASLDQLRKDRICLEEILA